jgi:hypothetical protein
MSMPVAAVPIPATAISLTMPSASMRSSVIRCSSLIIVVVSWMIISARTTDVIGVTSIPGFNRTDSDYCDQRQHQFAHRSLSAFGFLFGFEDSH